MNRWKNWLYSLNYAIKKSILSKFYEQIIFGKKNLNLLKNDAFNTTFFELNNEIFWYYNNNNAHKKSWKIVNNVR